MTAPRPAGDPNIPISEMFLSVQGEGALTGMPSFFIRTSGCNLRCSWCDTPYASWNPEGETTPVSDLVDAAEASGVEHVVITGGEPMIVGALPELCERLRDSGLHITIETAGTAIPEAGMPACDLMSISPKLANSTPVDDPRDPKGVWRERHERRRRNPEVLARLMREADDYQLKFVVSAPGDLPEIEGIVGDTGASPKKVHLMPEGVTAPEPSRIEWVARACIERGWRYCHRVHIELFGNTRGT